MLKRILGLSLALSFLPFMAHAQYSGILNPQVLPAAADEEQAIQAAPDGTLRQTIVSTTPSSFRGVDEVEYKEGNFDDAEDAFIGEDAEEDADTAVDAIDDLSASLSGDTFVELSSTYQDLLVRPGTTFDVVLTTEAGRSWNYDPTDAKNIEMVGTNQDNNLTIYTFKAVKDGFERMYFDYVDRSNGAPSVVESRILDLSIGIPSAKKE